MVIKMAKKTYKAEGEARSLTSQRYSTPAAVKDGRDVVRMSQNIYLAQQLCNLESQLFPLEPEITVLDGDNNKVDDLTIRYKNMFLKAGLEKSVHVTFYEYMLYGCSVKTFTVFESKGVFYLDEIKDLPADTFYNSPECVTNYDTPNPLMRGLVVDEQTGALIAEQCIGNSNTRVRIENFAIMKEPSAPEPYGEAYCLPLYPIIAQIDQADRALSAQIHRVGTPLIFPKMSDESPENVQALNSWASKFLTKWGQNSGFLIPRGIELVSPNIYESSGAYERLESLKEAIAGFFNPTIVLRHAETGIGGSDAGAQRIYYNFIRYTQRWICKCYEQIGDNFLQANGYKGYTLHIKFPSVEPQNVEQIIAALNLLIQANAVTPEEIRRNLTGVLDLDETFEPQKETVKETETEEEEIPEETPEETNITVEEAEKSAVDAADVVTANSINDILKLMRS